MRFHGRRGEREKRLRGRLCGVGALSSPGHPVGLHAPAAGSGAGLPLNTFGRKTFRARCLSFSFRLMRLAMTVMPTALLGAERFHLEFDRHRSGMFEFQRPLDHLPLLERLLQAQHHHVK